MWICLSFPCSLSISLQEIKLIQTVNWIFHVSHLWRCYNIYQANFVKVLFYWLIFIFITGTFLLNIMVVPKITCCNWFIIIIMFFKKVLNISNYFVFNCFVFVFWSKNVSYIFNWFFIYIYSSSKKDFCISLIMLSSVFIMFFKLSNLHISFYFSFLGLKGCSWSLDSASGFFNILLFELSHPYNDEKKKKTNKIYLSLVVFKWVLRDL